MAQVLPAGPAGGHPNEVDRFVPPSSRSPVGTKAWGCRQRRGSRNDHASAGRPVLACCTSQHRIDARLLVDRDGTQSHPRPVSGAAPACRLRLVGVATSRQQLPNMPRTKLAGPLHYTNYRPFSFRASCPCKTRTPKDSSVPMNNPFGK